jgi:hypothetical protein
MNLSTQAIRAGLMARTFLVTAALVWIASVDTRLVIPLALALPFWIAAEVEAAGWVRAATQSLRTRGRSSVPSLRPTLEFTRRSLTSSLPPLTTTYH